MKKKLKESLGTHRESNLLKEIELEEGNYLLNQRRGRMLSLL
jgi:hypothetical protein